MISNISSPALSFIYLLHSLSKPFVSIEGLKKYFEQFGRVEACTIMRDATGRSRCFAFLTFEDPASVNAVMVKEHILDGKIVCILFVFL